MTVGFAILAHEALHRTAAVARHLAAEGAPVVVHVDNRVPGRTISTLASELAAAGPIRVISRTACQWGEWSVVEATKAACRELLSAEREVGHVALLSGACLPLRPVAEMEAFLAEAPETDFIESVRSREADWVTGGLAEERFSLHFPLSWSRHRRAFDGAVALQRRLGIRRRAPAGLVPHLGSQWWCLSRATLQAILTSPDADRHDAFFRRSWIPDESYFQTLARLHSRRLRSRSLTWSRFDPSGRPFVLYDDHAALLRQTDAFFARKVWAGAEGLYETFLSENLSRRRATARPDLVEAHFAQAARRSGPPALHLDRPRAVAGTARRPIWVFLGFSAAFEGFADWLAARTGADVHGRLFAPDGAVFAKGATLVRGGLTASADLRDANPVQFLANLAAGSDGRALAFDLHPADRGGILRQLVRRAEVRICALPGAWALAKSRGNAPAAAMLRQAHRLQRGEAAHLGMLATESPAAGIRIASLADAATNPARCLGGLLDTLDAAPGDGGGQPIPRGPGLFDLRRAEDLLSRLRDQGLNPQALAPVRAARLALEDAAGSGPDLHRLPA